VPDQTKHARAKEHTGEEHTMIEHSDCIEPKLDAGSALPPEWRIIGTPWKNYCAVRSGAEDLPVEERRAMTSSFTKRFFPPIDPHGRTIYDGGVSGIGYGLCRRLNVPECPNDRCFCLSITELKCAVALVDLALMVEEELARQELENVRVIACLRVNVPPSEEE